MKKVGVLLVMIILLSSLSLAAGSYKAVQDIQVTLLSQEPDPVKPGEIVEVKFKIENLGKETQENVQVEIMPDFPFSLYTGDGLVNLGKLRAGQSGADAVIVNYKIKVDEKAVEGDNEIELRVRVGQQSWVLYTNDEFTISVETPDAILGLEDIYTKPDSLVPGQEGLLYIKLVNNADSLLRNIKIKLDFSSADLPLVSTSSVGEKSTALLERGEEKWLIFNVAPEADAEAKIYKVPIELTYFDGVGNEYSKNDYIGLKVGDEPELLVYVSETEVYSKGQKGLVTITIANHGLANVKLMRMTLLPSENYEVISASEIYIGDVDSDDIESQDFDIYVSDGKDSIDLPVKLEYRDSNNKKIEQTYQVGLKLYSSWEAKKFGLKSSNIVVWLVILVILGVVGYFLYRKFWRKKKKKQ